MGINLHALVRSAISAVHPDEVVVLVRSCGQENIRGRIVARYAAPILVWAQIQTLSPDSLAHMEAISETRIDRKVYLWTDPHPANKIAGIIRPLARSGDFIYRGDGSWWLVTAVLEDFAKVHWSCVGVTEQLTPPARVIDVYQVANIYAEWDMYAIQPIPAGAPLRGRIYG